MELPWPVQACTGISSCYLNCLTACSHSEYGTSVWDLTAEAASKYCYVLVWDVGKTNFPDSRDDAQLTSPHSVPLAPVVEGI